ncbi:MAG: hypothetical protein VKO64_10330 [Candidatus Sericytochromatia bacterium]|nr:hypothetical protein [Candidatus Sericytochromatia bacterium]
MILPVLVASATVLPDLPRCAGVSWGGKGAARWARLSGAERVALDRFEACWRRAGWQAEIDPQVLDGDAAPGRLRLWRKGVWRATVFSVRDAGGRALCLVVTDRDSRKSAPGGH